MKRKYFSSLGLLCPITMIIVFILVGIGLCLKFDLNEPIKVFVFIVLLLVDILCIVGATWLLMFVAGYFVLEKDNIKTKLHSWRKLTNVPVESIKEIVICDESLLAANSRDVVLRVNSKNGLIIGYGRIALNTLLQTYPTMKFRVHYIGRGLGKKNTILLGQRGCLGKFKIRQFAQIFHLPSDFAQPNIEDAD